MNDEPKTTTEEKVDAPETEVEVEEQPEKEAPQEPTEEPGAKNTENEIDYDAEIEEERKKGKPDPEKAKEAFLKRQAKREQESTVENDDDKPLTKRELQEILAAQRVELQMKDAISFATQLAGSEKEALLIVEKWKNRTFPPTLSLQEQIEEAFAITHRKKILGERNEAIRALKAKSNVSTNAATTHRDAPQSTEPKISPQDATALKAAGFLWNGVSRRYERKLPNGDLLYRDPKTKATIRIPKNK